MESGFKPQDSGGRVCALNYLLSSNCAPKYCTMWFKNKNVSAFFHLPQCTGGKTGNFKRGHSLYQSHTVNRDRACIRSQVSLTIDRVTVPLKAQLRLIHPAFHNYRAPSTIFGIGDMAVNKTEKVPPFTELTFVA